MSSLAAGLEAYTSAGDATSSNGELVTVRRHSEYPIQPLQDYYTTSTNATVPTERLYAEAMQHSGTQGTTATWATRWKTSTKQTLNISSFRLLQRKKDTSLQAAFRPLPHVTTIRLSAPNGTP